MGSTNLESKISRSLNAQSAGERLFATLISVVTGINFNSFPSSDK